MRKRDSNTVPGPQVPTAAGRGEHQQQRGLKGPWVGGWWHGRVGRVRAGWCARWGREGDAWRGAGCEGGGGWFTRGCSPRGRAGSVWLEGLPCSPFAHARLRFFSRSAGPTRARRPPPRPRACSGSSACMLACSTERTSSPARLPAACLPRARLPAPRALLPRCGRAQTRVAARARPWALLMLQSACLHVRMLACRPERTRVRLRKHAQAWPCGSG